MDEIKIQSYSEYKDSGAEWMDKIPIHWISIRMKHLFRDVSIKNKAGEELLSVTQDQGVVPRNWVEDRMVMPSGALESFKFIHKGDFAISLRSFEGGLEYCHHDGIISPAYSVLKAQIDFDGQFYKYLFKSVSFISELQTSVVGIRQGKNISYPELSYSFLPVPPKAEQTAISQFLNRKITLIVQAIKFKEKQIELLKERRQILIHKAVTRGLNPNVKMKDSGVEWLGEIPQHWKTIKLKLLSSKITDGEHISPIFTSGGMAFLSAKDVREGYIEFPDNKFVSLRDGKKFRLRCKPEIGDILLVSRGATIGRVSQVITNEEFCLLGSVILIKPNAKIESNYLLRSMENKSLQDNLLNTSHFSAQQAIYLVTVSEVKIAVPPKEEQIKIVHYIEVVVSKITTVISLKKKEIEKLKEYKSTLINSAVTGKIKVC